MTVLKFTAIDPTRVAPRPASLPDPRTVRVVSPYTQSRARGLTVVIPARRMSLSSASKLRTYADIR